MATSTPVFISEIEIKKYLSWPLVFQAVDRALRSVCEAVPVTSVHQPLAVQQARSITRLPDNSGNTNVSHIN